MVGIIPGRFKGSAESHPDGEMYERGLRQLAERGYNASRERVRLNGGQPKKEAPGA
jgi:hypothetical protein